MVSFEREFLAKCHAEAERRDGSVACKYCGRDYEWHVWEGVYRGEPKSMATRCTRADSKAQNGALRRSGTADANTELRGAEAPKPEHDLDGYPHLADFRVFTQYRSYSPRLGG